jgi:hypothetical protein
LFLHPIRTSSLSSSSKVMGAAFLRGGSLLVPQLPLLTCFYQLRSYRWRTMVCFFTCRHFLVPILFYVILYAHNMKTIVVRAITQQWELKPHILETNIILNSASTWRCIPQLLQTSTPTGATLLDHIIPYLERSHCVFLWFLHYWHEPIAFILNPLPILLPGLIVAGHRI